MDSMLAFARGAAHRNDRMRVFDWDRAARLIVENNARHVGAGLSGDWEYTGGDIYNGSIVAESDTYTYLASTWAIPELTIDGVTVDCWRWMDETDWNSGTYWPDSARAILANG